MAVFLFYYVRVALTVLCCLIITFLFSFCLMHMGCCFFGTVRGSDVWLSGVEQLRFDGVSRGGHGTKALAGSIWLSNWRCVPWPIYCILSVWWQLSFSF